MRIFVTGASGFVGTHTLAELQKKGHKLLVLSHQSPKHIFSNFRNVTYVRGDLASISKWKSKLLRFKPEAALHMAWEGIPDYNLVNSLKNLSYGIDLTRVLAAAGCKKVIVTGSCWEYGAEAGKIREDRQVDTKNFFSAAKTALRLLGKEIAKEGNMQFIWARIFYVYGPGQKSVSLIPHLINEKLRGNPPVVKNPNGGNDFVYVEDVARALQMLIEKKTPYDIYNIGSGRLTGVREVIKAVYGKDILKRKGPAKGFYADIGRIKKDIGWKPTTPIKKGIGIMMRSMLARR